MKNILIAIVCAAALVSCGDTSGVKSKNNNPDGSGKKGSKDVEITRGGKDSTRVNLDAKHEVVDAMTLSNGIKINWFKHGTGDVVKNGDMIDINYRVYLENGKLVEGLQGDNQSIPFMVGFQMQPGWDHALRELRIGDHAEIFIPYQMGRGEKGVKDLIPPKSNTIVKIQVIGLSEPTRELEGGTRVWLLKENKNIKETFGPEKRIYFHCYISSPTNPMYYDTQVQNNPFNYGYDEPGLVPGIRKALINAKKADLMLVHVPAAQAYGNQGYLDLVKPNEDLFYRIFVMEVKNK